MTNNPSCWQHDPGRLFIALLLISVLTACSSLSPNRSTNPNVGRNDVPVVAKAEAKKPSTTRGGGYYKDDGPGEQIPEGLMDTPDAEPRVEPFARGPSKPYAVFEKTYTPITDNRPFIQRGIGSWYGKKFHGQRTASGEIYNMFKMTAAHATLPIPSYARVTNLQNGKRVIVRINDRGPFHSERIIDLSYTAALKLGYLNHGSSELEVERLLPEEIARINLENRTKASAPVQMAAEPAPPASMPAQTQTNQQDAIERVAINGRAAPAAVGGGGFYLQLGAYTQTQNAQAMLDQLMSNWPENIPKPMLVQSQGLYRLHSGPFANREEASKTALQLQSVAQIKTSLVQK